MDLKTEDIFAVDIDPTILLTYDLDKLSLNKQSDVESTLSCVEGNKITEIINCSKDSENQNLKTSVTNVESIEGLIPEDELEGKKDINGNEESLSDENLNQHFRELELSDSDNEQNDEEGSSKLRERGPVGRHSTRSRNRTNYLARNEVHDRSQFPPQSLNFMSGSTILQVTDTATTANQYTLQNNNQSSLLNIREIVYNIPSNDHVSSSYPIAYKDPKTNSVVYEDPGCNSLGSPESGYASSIPGSPPHVSLFTSISTCLDSVPETDHDQIIVDLLDSALAGDNVPRYCTDDRDPEGKISALVEYLKDTNEVTEPSGEGVASSFNSEDNETLVNNSQDINAYPAIISSRLRSLETPKKIEYKLENKAKIALREFLEKDELYATELQIYQQIIEDTANNREIKVIRVIDEIEKEQGSKTSENRTNLHHAVLKCNIVEIYCLVEIQKQYGKPFTDLNIRDKYGKTALDYAVQNDMTLVVDYLKENTACQSVTI